MDLTSLPTLFAPVDTRLLVPIWPGLIFIHIWALVLSYHFYPAYTSLSSSCIPRSLSGVWSSPPLEDTVFPSTMDNGGEYVSPKFNEFLSKHSISHQTLVPL